MFMRMHHQNHLNKYLENEHAEVFGGHFLLDLNTKLTTSTLLNSYNRLHLPKEKKYCFVTTEMYSFVFIKPVYYCIFTGISVFELSM